VRCQVLRLLVAGILLAGFSPGVSADAGPGVSEGDRAPVADAGRDAPSAHTLGTEARGPGTGAPGPGTAARGLRVAARVLGADARVLGVVLDHDHGVPLASALVSLRPPEGEPRLTTTDPTGRFTFEDVPPGRYELTVSHPGYHPSSDVLQVRAEADHELILELSSSPIELAPIVTVVPRTPFLLRGFEARRAIGRGTFFDREELERRNARTTSDIFRGLGGIRLVPARGAGYALRFRGDCVPSVWVNGARTVYDPEFELSVDSAVNTNDVAAVEIYQGAAAVPPQFGPDPCGAVLFWTRSGRNAERDGEAVSHLARTVLLVSLVTLALFLR
jgi:hypothetical protein